MTISQKESDKKYYEANKEKIAARKKKYRAENKEKTSQYKRKWNDKNKEKMAFYNKKYYEQNKENICKRIKKYWKDNHEKITDAYVRKLIVSNSTLQPKDIPQDLVELIKLKIQIERRITNEKNKQND